MRRRERNREVYVAKQKEQILENFNQLYMKRTDRKLRVVRYEKIQDYKRQKTKEEIEERMRRAEKMRIQKELIRFERLRINEEVRQKKNKMIARFKRILHDDNHYTNEEIVDFVIKGEKIPKQKELMERKKKEEEEEQKKKEEEEKKREEEEEEKKKKIRINKKKN